MKSGSVTYTFPADCRVPELRGITCHGGVFCRADHKTCGEPDAVRFDLRINGRQVVALIAGKPELEAALAAHKADISAKETMLASLGWPAYQAAQRLAHNAKHEYDRASEYGYPARESAALRRALAALDEARATYPLAALYARAEAFSEAANYIKAAAGQRAMDAIEAGAEPAAAIASMEAEWDAYCRRATES